jgi:hypothetical protein
MPKPKPGLPEHLRMARDRVVRERKAVRAQAEVGMTDAQIEAMLVSGLLPQWRKVAELRANGQTPTQIARVMGITRPHVYSIMRKPEVKAAFGYYRKSLHEKVVQVQHMAANALPRGVEKTVALLEQDIDPRHIINATAALAKMAMMSESRGDTVGQKIVINLTPDAARQLRTTGLGGAVGKLAQAAEVEWEEIVDAPEEER